MPNSNFFVPGLRITEHNEAGNESSRYVNEYSGCFYNGVVNGDDKSSVAVSLCHGMVILYPFHTNLFSLLPTCQHSLNSGEKILMFGS